MVVTRGLEEERMGSSYLTGMQFQYGKMKKFWRWIMMMVAQQCEYLMQMNFILANG